MPRQRRAAPAPSRSAPSRPTVAPQRPAGTAPQSRSASTAAHPGGQTQAPPQQASGGGGMFGSFVSTAAGVAVGSTLGHTISGMFGGGSTAAEQVDPVLQAQSQEPAYARSCDADAKAFTKCLDENKGEHAMSICGWYMDQLKACQQAAKPY